MIFKLYSVYDRQAQTYNQPQFLIQPGQAVRAFSTEVNRAAADNPLYTHPDDFDLYSLGTFDTDTGVITSSVEVLTLGKNLKLNGG